MTQDAQDRMPTIFPYFSYRDASAALKWLAEAFGFAKTAEVRGADGKIIHAEMRFGTGAIMLGTASEPHVTNPRDTAPGSGIYVYVSDVDAHYARSKAAGARIVYPPEDTDFGTRRYRVLDLEGYEWSFGTYRPSTLP